MTNKMYRHFNKNTPAFWHYHAGYRLAEICDGITGLIMLPFGRYGTSFVMGWAGKILRYQKMARDTAAIKKETK